MRRSPEQEAALERMDGIVTVHESKLFLEVGLKMFDDIIKDGFELDDGIDYLTTQIREHVKKNGCHRINKKFNVNIRVDKVCDNPYDTPDRLSIESLMESMIEKFMMGIKEDEELVITVAEIEEVK